MLRQICLKRTLIAISLTSAIGFLGFYPPEIAWAKKDDPDSGQGFPTRRVGGGTRGCNGINQEDSCLSLNSHNQKGQLPSNPYLSRLIALIPDNLTLTSQASPTLYFYLPQIERPQDVKLEFVLRDENDRQVYQRTFSTDGKAGIIALKIADSAELESLVLEGNYHWYLSIIYNPSDRADDEVVEGWLRRVPLEPSLAQKLEAANPVEQVQLYQEAGLWHEALDKLVDLKRSQPHDATILAMWTQFLQGINLEPVAQAPLL